MKSSIKLIIVLQLLLLGGCAIHPSGIWVSDASKQVYEINKKDKGNISIKTIPNGIPVTFIKVINDAPSKPDTIPPTWISSKDTLSLLERDLISLTNNNQKFYAYRLPKKEVDEEVINLAIAMEIKRRYPIKLEKWNSGRINGKSFRFEKCNIEFSRTGLLTIRGSQTTNRCEGFTGNVKVTIKDKDGNALVVVEFANQGIDGNCRGRTKGYNREINLTTLSQLKLTTEEKNQIIAGAHSLEAVGQRNGNPERITKLTERLKEVSKNISEAGGDITKVIAQLNGL